MIFVCGRGNLRGDKGDSGAEPIWEADQQDHGPVDMKMPRNRARFPSRRLIPLAMGLEPQATHGVISTVDDIVISTVDDIVKEAEDGDGGGSHSEVER